MSKDGRMIAATVLVLELAVPMAAKRDRVWRALVKETKAWWPRAFYTNERAKALKIEPKLGGRMFEDWGRGDGLIWYSVIGVEDRHSLDLAGHMTTAFGGPATTLLRLEIEDRGKESILNVTDSMIGRLPPDCAETKRTGWLTLFRDGLKAHVEKSISRPTADRTSKKIAAE